MQLIISVVLLFSFIYFVKKENVVMLIYSLFLLSPAIYVFAPQMPIKRFIVLALLLIYIKHRFFVWGNYQGSGFPLKKIILLMVFGSVAFTLFDDRLDLMAKITYPFYDALNVYAALFLVFILFRNKTDIVNSIYKPVMVCCIIIEIYGIFNFIFDANPIAELISSIYNQEHIMKLLNVLDGAERKGVLSIYRYSFDYGFNSGLIFLYLLYYLFNNKVNAIHYVCMGLSFVGVFLCGSRTIIISMIFASAIYFMISHRSVRKVKIFLSAIVVSSLSYLFVPQINNMVNITIDTLIYQDSNLDKGSSVSMRTAQMAGAVILWEKSPIIGNGYNYIFVDLNWKKGTYHGKMAGFESIVYSLLIERGIVGIFVYVIFFFVLLLYFYTNRKVPISVFGISTICFFLFYAIGTGVLDAYVNMMAFIGISIACIESKTKEKIENDYYGCVCDNCKL